MKTFLLNLIKSGFNAFFYVFFTLSIVAIIADIVVVIPWMIGLTKLSLGVHTAILFGVIIHTIGMILPAQRPSFHGETFLNRIYKKYYSGFFRGTYFIVQSVLFIICAAQIETLYTPEAANLVKILVYSVLVVVTLMTITHTLVREKS